MIFIPNWLGGGVGGVKTSAVTPNANKKVTIFNQMSEIHTYMYIQYAALLKTKKKKLKITKKGKKFKI